MAIFDLLTSTDQCVSDELAQHTEGCLKYTTILLHADRRKFDSILTGTSLERQDVSC